VKERLHIVLEPMVVGCCPGCRLGRAGRGMIVGQEWPNDVLAQHQRAVMARVVGGVVS
jgi:hypothetical protein